MSSRKKLVVMGLIILGALTYLLASGFDSHSMHRADISEIMSDPAKFKDKGIKVTGTVIDGSITKTPLSAVFSVHDVESNKNMQVIYKGVVPDNFQEDIDVILEGRYDAAANKFLADKLLTKCPSRYEGMDYNDHKKAMADKNADI